MAAAKMDVQHTSKRTTALSRLDGPRTRSLRVVVSDKEAELITASAKAFCQSVSAYLRGLGLGQAPKSRLDQKLILDLLKINGDQGRLGGLLKLWLSEKPGVGAPAFDVRRLLRQIEDTQTKLQKAVERL